jgi:hypothetical protein
MALPEQHLPKKRRLQILDDETRDGHRFNGREGGVHEDNWTSNFVARLAGLVRKIGGKD